MVHKIKIANFVPHISVFLLLCAKMHVRTTWCSFFFLFFLFIFISWTLITLQYCTGFCHTLAWISHGFACIPHHDPPSHLPLHPIPLGLPSMVFLQRRATTVPASSASSTSLSESYAPPSLRWSSTIWQLHCWGYSCTWCLNGFTRINAASLSLRFNFIFPTSAPPTAVKNVWSNHQTMEF